MGQQNSSTQDYVDNQPQILRERSMAVSGNNSLQKTAEADEWYKSGEIDINDIEKTWNKKIISKSGLYDDLTQNYNKHWENLQTEYKELIEIIRKYKNQQSDKTIRAQYDYGHLTEFVKDNGVRWETLHNFRESIYVNISFNLIKLGYSSFKKFGSKSRGSDIDITITKDHTDVAYLFAYSFGVYNSFIFESTINKYNCTGFVESYLNEFQLIFDVVPYSSNGIISIPNSSVDKTNLSYKKFLHPLVSDEKDTSYQIVHKYVCERQSEVYDVVCIVLLLRIQNTIKIKGIKNDKVYDRFESRLDDIFRTSSEKTCRLAKYIYNLFDGYNSLEKFKTQLWASDKSNHFAERIVTTDFITTSTVPIYYCSNAASWEFYQIVANAASPEASTAVQTFVTTVLSGQRGLINEVDLQNDLIWISCIENLWSILHQKEEGSIRKQYKYSFRALELIYIMLGTTGDLIKNIGEIIIFSPKSSGGISQPTPLKFSKTEMNNLRDEDDNTKIKQVSEKLDVILTFLLENLLTVFPPPRIRYKINISKSR